MKKIFAVLFAGCFATSVFAIDLSVGAGLDYSMNIGSMKIKGSLLDIATKTTENYIGANLFFDAQYLRLVFGADFGVGGKNTQVDGSLGPLATKLGGLTGESGSISDYRETDLNLSVLGKYPFKLGFVNLYPLLGFDFSFNVAAKYGDIDLRENASDKAKQDLNHYYFVFGLGADVNIGKKFFITPTATFGVDLKKQSRYETVKKATDFANAKYTDNNFLVNVGLGFGYRL